MISALMNIGMLLITAASIPSMLAVLKTRSDLKGFSIMGLVVNIVANICFGAAQMMLGIWLSAVLNMVVLVYTLVVLFYVWRCRK